MESTPTPLSPPHPSNHPILLQQRRQRSRTFNQVEEDERREREREREEADRGMGSSRGRETGEESRDENGEISAVELRAEMETLLSLRRRSLSQPVSLDPDLPLSPNLSPSSPRPSLSISIGAPPSSSLPPPPHSPTSGSEPAETGTLVRRPSTSQKLPSHHPVPHSPHNSPPLPLAYSPTNDGAAAAHSSQDLFWLPASLHPELAPQEFKAFIREQTRPDNLARRVSGSANTSPIDRKRSMLRGEYKPRTDDGVGEESETTTTSGSPTTPTGDQSRRIRISGGSRTTARGSFEDLTIKDLQRLEELAARAEAEGATEGEGEGEHLGRVLRRSLSLNPNHVAAAAAAGGSLAGFPFESTSPTSDAPLSADSPLIIPGQILKRSARTKIRKAGLVGDGGGHRFGPSRRARTSSASENDQMADDSESIGDHTIEDGNRSTKNDVLELQNLRHSSGSDVSGEVHVTSTEPADSPTSVYSGSIYSQNSPADDILSPVSLSPSFSLPSLFQSTPTITTSSIDAPMIYAPLPVSPLISPTLVSPSSAEFDWSTDQQQQQYSQPYRSYELGQTLSAPSTSSHTISPRSVSAPPLIIQHASDYRTSSGPRDGKEKDRMGVREGKEKEKKSGWARLGLSSGKSTAAVTDEEERLRKNQRVESAPKKSQQVNNIEKDKEYREKDREKEKEKDSAGFFGALFGRRKSDQDLANQHVPSYSPPSPDLRMVQHAPSPTASGEMGPGGRYLNFFRLPIHVERAVYRLSHIKLANPRRPLYEQVLISNLMFNYLAIIAAVTVPVPIAVPVPAPIAPARESNGKRPGLTKNSSEAGRRSSSRSGETPVRQPQYSEQGRQIDEEALRRPASPPSPSSPTSPNHYQHQQQYQQQQQQQQYYQPIPSPPRSSSNPSQRSTSPSPDQYNRNNSISASSPYDTAPHRPVPVSGYRDSSHDPVSRDKRSSASSSSEGAGAFDDFLAAYSSDSPSDDGSNMNRRSVEEMELGHKRRSQSNRPELLRSSSSESIERRSTPSPPPGARSGR